MGGHARIPHGSESVAASVWRNLRVGVRIDVECRVPKVEQVHDVRGAAHAHCEVLRLHVAHDYATRVHKLEPRELQERTSVMRLKTTASDGRDRPFALPTCKSCAV